MNFEMFYGSRCEIVVTTIKNTTKKLLEEIEFCWCLCESKYRKPMHDVHCIQHDLNVYVLSLNPTLMFIDTDCINETLISTEAFIATSILSTFVIFTSNLKCVPLYTNE